MIAGNTAAMASFTALKQGYAERMAVQMPRMKEALALLPVFEELSKCNLVTTAALGAMSACAERGAVGVRIQMQSATRTRSHQFEGVHMFCAWGSAEERRMLYHWSELIVDGRRRRCAKDAAATGENDARH